MWTNIHVMCLSTVNGCGGCLTIYSNYKHLRLYCHHISNMSYDRVHWLGLEAVGRREPETPYLTLEWVRLSCRLWCPWESCCSSTERGRLVLEAWVLLEGAVGAAMPISRSNKLGFCGATIGVKGRWIARNMEALVDVRVFLYDYCSESKE